jgi:hypothetical protein
MKITQLIALWGGLTSTAVLLILLIFEIVERKEQTITFFLFHEGYIEIAFFIIVIISSIISIKRTIDNKGEYNSQL